MLCQRCGKNEAELYFVQNINGQKSDVLICGECATVTGVAFSPISFVNFIQGFLDAAESVKFTESETETKVCDVCGLTLDKIKRLGKAGCSNCYDVFKTQMHSIIKNVQAGDVHKGRYPKNAKAVLAKNEIKTLRSKLTEAVEKEEYEEAAKIRDLIRDIEGRR